MDRGYRNAALDCVLSAARNPRYDRSGQGPVRHCVHPVIPEISIRTPLDSPIDSSSLQARHGFLFNLRPALVSSFEAPANREPDPQSAADIFDGRGRQGWQARVVAVAAKTQYFRLSDEDGIFQARYFPPCAIDHSPQTQ